MNIPNNLIEKRGIGLINVDYKRLDTKRENAFKLNTLYSGIAIYGLAKSLEDRAPNFIDRVDAKALLKEFEVFWNSSSHTNFDQV